MGDVPSSRRRVRWAAARRATVRIKSNQVDLVSLTRRVRRVAGGAGGGASKRQSPRPGAPPCHPFPCRDPFVTHQSPRRDPPWCHPRDLPWCNPPSNLRAVTPPVLPSFVAQPRVVCSKYATLMVCAPVAGVTSHVVARWCVWCEVSERCRSGWC